MVSASNASVFFVFNYDTGQLLHKCRRPALVRNGTPLLYSPTQLTSGARSRGVHTRKESRTSRRRGQECGFCLTIAASFDGCFRIWDINSGAFSISSACFVNVQFHLKMYKSIECEPITRSLRALRSGPRPPGSTCRSPMLR